MFVRHGETKQAKDMKVALDQTGIVNGKAVGTRDRVVGWLAANGGVEDPSGMASTALARAIGYPGSSIAFAQLLSSMERSGLIEREVRGKRTYGVTLTEQGKERATTIIGAGPRGEALRRPSALGTPSVDPAPAERHAPAEKVVDYDELARRMLYQVARRLAGDEARLSEDRQTLRQGSDHHVDQLEQRVHVLETEFARDQAARLALERQNTELRSQLERIRADLGGESRRPLRPHNAPLADQVDRRDIALLQRLLMERQAGGRMADNANSA